MSRCFYHPEIETDVRCDICGKPICEHCRTTRNGKVVCPRCLQREERARANGAQNAAHDDSPAWVGLVLPGLAQLLKGETYKGSLLLVYFFLAAFSGEAVFIFLAYGVSIWDYFYPLVEEESKGRALINFRQFAGLVILFIGIALLARNIIWALNTVSRDLASGLAAIVTIALGLFVIWYHTGGHRKEVR